MLVQNVLKLCYFLQFKCFTFVLQYRWVSIRTTLITIFLHAMTVIVNCWAELLKCYFYLRIPYIRWKGITFSCMFVTCKYIYCISAHMLAELFSYSALNFYLKLGEAFWKLPVLNLYINNLFKNQISLWRCFLTFQMCS